MRGFVFLGVPLQHIEHRAAHGGEAASARFEELTHRGTRIAGGRIWEDPNPDLQDLAERIEVYKDMAATDPVLAGQIAMIEESARPARFTVAPRNPTQAAGRIADFVAWALDLSSPGRMTRPLTQCATELLLYAPFGFAYSEPIWGVETVKAGRWKGAARIVLRDLKFCDQSAHDQWVLSDDHRELAGITQHPPYGGYARPAGNRRVPWSQVMGQTVTPRSKLVLVTHRGRGHNFEGLGMLRPCVQLWRLKNLVLDSMAVANEKWAIPTPVVEIDREAATRLGYTPAQTDAAIDAASTALESYGAGRLKYMRSTPAVKFSTFGDGQIDSRQAIEVVKLCDRQMTMAFAGQFATLGIGDVGSRSVGEIHRTMHARTVGKLMDHLTDALNRDVVYPLVAWNFGKEIADDLCPSLRHHDVDEGLIAGALGTLAPLIQAGALKPTQAFRRLLLRELAGPTAGEELAEADAAAPDMPAPAGGGLWQPGPGRPREEG